MGYVTTLIYFNLNTNMSFKLHKHEWQYQPVQKIIYIIYLYHHIHEVLGSPCCEFLQKTRSEPDLSRLGCGPGRIGNLLCKSVENIWFDFYQILSWNSKFFPYFFVIFFSFPTRIECIFTSHILFCSSVFVPSRYLTCTVKVKLQWWYTIT